MWSPDDRGVVFVGWWHKPFRLGLRACSNRRWVPQHQAGMAVLCWLSMAVGVSIPMRLQPDPHLLPRSGIFHLDLASGRCGEYQDVGCALGVPGVLNPATRRAAVG